MTTNDATREAARIVVGIDGSEPSLRALEFAIEEARLRGGFVQAIHSFPSPTYVGVPTPLDYYEQIQAEAEKELDAAIAKVSGAAEAPGLVRSVVPESPTAAIVDASEGAALVVVGSRGRGGLAGLVLGSVSTQVAGHAHCPVVIVRPEKR